MGSKPREDGEAVQRELELELEPEMFELLEDEEKYDIPDLLQEVLIYYNHDTRVMLNE